MVLPRKTQAFAFVESNVTGLDFDTSDGAPIAEAIPPDFAAVSPPAIHNDISILWLEDGLLESDDLDLAIFSVDVPDGVSTFTLRHSPLIPEPSTLALSTLAIGCLLTPRPLRTPLSEQ